MTGKERWYGIVFNGEKVGFSRFSILSLSDTQEFIIVGETHMVIRFLGLKRHVRMNTEDTVHPDLSLKSFIYRQQIDGSELEITGKRKDDTLFLKVKSQGEERVMRLSAKEKVYPASAINLYPALRGLHVGNQYRYRVFEPQTMHIYEVEQKVTNFEAAPRLGLNPSFRVETEMQGFSATTWFNQTGETEMERGLSGVLITYRESEEEAKRYLVEAGLAKKDLAADFSLVKVERPITCPRQARSLTVAISGLGGLIEPPAGSGQKITKAGHEVIIHIDTKHLSEEREGQENLSSLYLSSHPQIEVYHPEIRKTAREIITDGLGEKEIILRLNQWVAKEIAQDFTDSFSALEVLKTRKGDCQAHTLLYTALARALGIPTRLVGGLVYMEGQGFLYHSWAESYAKGWLPVDPTFGQVPADATHIKLVVGPDWSSFLSLSKVMGRIKIKIMDYTCDEGH